MATITGIQQPVKTPPAHPQPPKAVASTQKAATNTAPGDRVELSSKAKAIFQQQTVKTSQLNKPASAGKK